MKRIIKLVDVNVDGCGTSVETLIQIEGIRSLRYQARILGHSMTE